MNGGWDPEISRDTGGWQKKKKKGWWHGEEKPKGDKRVIIEYCQTQGRKALAGESG